MRFVRARHTIVLFAYAGAITCAAPAFIVGVFVVGNGTASAIRALVFLGRGAGLTRAQTPAVTTYAVRAIARCALRRCRACRAIGKCRLRARRARTRAITIAVRAFVIGIGSCFDRATNTILTAAFFRCATCLATAHANVVAAKAVHAIVRQTLRPGYTGKTIVVFALIFPVARAVRTIVIGIGVVFDRPTNSIDAAAFFRQATRHAFVVAFAVTAESIDAISRRALRAGCTRGRIRWFHKRCKISTFG